MESGNGQEQGSGRIAAALLTTLKRLSDVQESQKRIEDRQQESGEELARYTERQVKIENDLGQGLGAVDGRIESVRIAGEALGKSIEKLREEKKPVRWKHHLRAGGILLGVLGVGLVVGWLWALSWLRVDETARMSMENERLSMENEKLSMDAERDIGHAVMVKLKNADEEHRHLIAALLSSEEMSKEQRKKIRKWLNARTGKSSGGKPGK